MVANKTAAVNEVPSQKARLGARKFRKQQMSTPLLGLHASAKLREHLIEEIRALASSEEATKWVPSRLAEESAANIRRRACGSQFSNRSWRSSDAC